MLSKRLRRMSPAHQATAKMLVAHFARVLGHTANNKMSAQALTLCLNPVLFPEETSISAVSQGHKVSERLSHSCTFLSDSCVSDSL